MDSKQVNKEINSNIRPILKENGFKNFSGRTYWRYNSDRIDILSFQSFNAYNAEIMGCTAFSFGIKLATFIKYIPNKSKIKEKDGLLKPADYQSHFRGGVKKRIIQKELPRNDVWFVSKNGENLSNVISDSKIQIQKMAFDWFKQFETTENVLRILLNSQDDMENIWGFGNMDSPSRNKFIGYTALEMNRIDLSLLHLEKVVNFYEIEYEKVKNDYYSRDLKDHYFEIMVSTKKTIEQIKTTHNNV